MTPFESFDDEAFQPGQRGYRAVVTIGQLDTQVRGLSPLDERFRLTGASSDLAVLNVGDEAAGLRVGDSISFRPDYGSLVRLMLSPYVDKVVIPPLDEYVRSVGQEDLIEVPPAHDEFER